MGIMKIQQSFITCMSWIIIMIWVINWILDEVIHSLSAEKVGEKTDLQMLLKALKSWKIFKIIGMRDKILNKANIFNIYRHMNL